MVRVSAVEALMPLDGTYCPSVLKGGKWLNFLPHKNSVFSYQTSRNSLNPVATYIFSNFCIVALNIHWIRVWASACDSSL